MPTLYHLRGFHEPFSAISHLVGAGLFLVLGILLLRRGRGDGRRLAFLGVYVAACVILMSMSGVYHMMVRGGMASRVMLRFDFSAIFVLIAGTFTPVQGLLFRGWMRTWPLVFVWTAAAAGIVLKTVFVYSVPESVGLSLYLALGWIGGISGAALWQRYGFAFVRPLLLGGVAYSAGAIAEYFGWPIVIPGVVHAHEVFHLAVLAGALLHFTFIWRFAAWEVPAERPIPNDVRETAMAQG